FCDTHQVSDCFLFDCVSRQLFLQDEFAKELDLIDREIAQPYRTVGALVLGEIELDQSGILSLHNKTAVAALAQAQSQDAT
ncbi:MAG: FIST C-terminal domain-containing protein, partial [Paraglaciecola chathamensis]